MDAPTITALFGGVTGALIAAGTFIGKIKSPDVEDVKKLTERVERAEKRADEAEADREKAEEETRKERDKRLLSEARVFHLLRVCQFHHINPDTEVP